MTTPTDLDPNAVAPAVANLETIVSLSKRRGFIFPSSEIYGGINAVWDYGPLGVELKNNVKRAWWRAMVQERDDIVGLDAGILMHPQVWVTSGHVGSFSDPLVECGTCHRRYRLDELPGAEDLSQTDLRDPDDRGTPRARVPQRRRPALGAAPVQPDVHEPHGPGGGRRERSSTSAPRRPRARTSTSRTSSRARARRSRSASPRSASRSATRSRPATSCSGCASSSRWRCSTSSARRTGPRPPSRSGCPSAGPGTRPTASTPRAPPLPGARAGRAGALREEGDRRRVPLPVRLEGAGGHPQPGRLRPRQPREGVRARTSSTSTRRRASTSSRGSWRRRPAPTGRRSRSSSTLPRGARPRGDARRARPPPGPRAVQGRGPAAAQEAPRDRRAVPPAARATSSAT